MAGCKLIIKDEVNIKLEGLPVDVRRRLTNRFRYEIPNARHTPPYKLGRWDGTVTYFGIGGDGYLNHLDEIIDELSKCNYQITDIEDHRRKVDLSMAEVGEDAWGDTRWPKGHPFEGELIRLRDYQVDIINNFLKNPQSLQSAATGSGKCLAGDTLISINLSKDTPLPLMLMSRVDMIADVTFEELADAIESLYGEKLKHEVAVDISELGITIEAPLLGTTNVNWFVKKEGLEAVEITLGDGDYKFKCSTHHQLMTDGEMIKAKDLKVGDVIDSRDDLEVITKIEPVGEIDCYDISVDAPHLYYDAYGVVHHNTIITATLSRCVEKFGRSIVIVPSKSLVTQTFADYKNCGLDVGMYFGDQKDIGATHTICTWQSLQAISKAYKEGRSDMSLADFSENVNTVIVDEAHKVGAKVLKDMLTRDFRFVPIRWGLTGTIPKEKHVFASLLTSVGPVINHVSAKDLQDVGVLANCHIHIKQFLDVGEYRTFQEEQEYTLGNTKRLEAIADMIRNECSEGNTLILIDRIATGEFLTEELDCHFVSGSMKNKDRKEIFDIINEGENEIAVATYGVASTGISIANLHNVVLVEPGKSFVKVIQSIGRGLRKSKTKDFVNIIDVTSTCKFSKRHLTKRKKYYKESGYNFSIEKIDWTTNKRR